MDATINEDETEDLSTIPELDEEILLGAISQRYHKDKIYTYVGDILIAVNPFKHIAIYGKEYSKRYQNIQQSTQPAHIYAVADAAYQALLGHRGKPPESQCIVISGESGAGKTESTKLLIKQIVELCKGNTQLEQQILQVSPLLEAFGNAQTNLNDNSSRFGKYIQLEFDGGHLVGGRISEYLLEKSRIVRQGLGEENFHIFYYLFGSDLQRKFQLGGVSDYRYLTDNEGRNLKFSNVQFENVISAMDAVGFTDEEQSNVFNIIASILHTGNIHFSVLEDESVAVINSDALMMAAKLLGVDNLEVKESLSCSRIVTNGEQLRRNHTKQTAEATRDGMAKALYGRLFGWIVNKINCLLAPESQRNNYLEIGILDIFGFEDFTKENGRNSFEQFCINLANEQLQFFFNRHVFYLEQEEYRKEGIDWTDITFDDNKPLLDLFLAKPIGILSLLDEESLFPKGTDQSFVNKLTQVVASNENFIKSQQTNAAEFSINHYTGKVLYSCENWLEKNRDLLPSAITELLRTSSNELIKTIFKGFISNTGSLSLQGRLATKKKNTQQYSVDSDSAIRKLTVGTQFKNSLNILMEKMTASNPLFIRCFKPNHDKLQGKLERDYLKNQLLYTGMLQTIEIRKRGFPVRQTFSQFIEKYKILVDFKMQESVENCIVILKSANLNGWSIGKSKVFLKFRHIEVLTELLQRRIQSGLHIQRGVRGFLARQKYRAMKEMYEADKLKKKIEAEKLKENLEAKQLKEKQQEEEKKIRIHPPLPREPINLQRIQSIPPRRTSKPLKTLEDFSNESGDLQNLTSTSEDIIIEDIPTAPPTNSSKFGAAGSSNSVHKWFDETQRQFVLKANYKSEFSEWFHGIISRRKAESLLENKTFGCFLIRVSESRFGYTLSFKTEGRCRHYIIEQLKNGKFLIIGENKIHRTLNDLVSYYKKNTLSNWQHFLTVPCGQNPGECDYGDLVNRETIIEVENPPVVPPRSYKSKMNSPKLKRGQL